MGARGLSIPSTLAVCIVIQEHSALELGSARPVRLDLAGPGDAHRLTGNRMGLQPFLLIYSNL